MKYIQNVKQILKRSIVIGAMLINPIQQYSCTYIDPDREPITLHEILWLINTDLGKKLNQVKDAFLFSCFTGFAYEETRNLTSENVIIGIDGNKWISIDRTKTGRPETVPLLPIPLKIIEKYQHHTCRIKENRLIPVFSNQYYNRRLKVVAKKCNILTDLTTHIARHTFATTVTLENDVLLPTVQRMLGHKSIKTTEKYSKVTKNKMARNMKRLQGLLFDDNGQLKSLQDVSQSHDLQSLIMQLIKMNMGVAI